VIANTGPAQCPHPLSDCIASGTVSGTVRGPDGLVPDVYVAVYRNVYEGYVGGDKTDAAARYEIGEVGCRARWQR
jgi:hypothetical protein